MITLYVANRSWVADYTAAPSAQRALILDLFGDLILPCAYSEQAAPQDVLAAIRRLNPAEEVWLRCQGCHAPIRRTWAPPDPALSEYHAGCRPGAGRIPYQLRA
jgi:hypothetical protein